MLERRPDVQARAALVQAHVARRRSAKTGFLPRFGMHHLATAGLVGLSVYVPVFQPWPHPRQQCRDRYASSLRSFAETIERHPNALVMGRSNP